MSDSPFLDAGQVECINAVLHEVSNESDRAAAVLLGAEIDRALLSILEAFILAPAKNSINLLSPDAALGSMGTRIEMAFGLGLISDAFHRELHLIRRIRNKFAHGPAGYCFADKPVCDLCRELAISGWVIHGRPSLAQHLGLKSPRNRFTIAGACAISLLSGLPNRICRVAPKPPEFSLDDRVA